MRREGGLPLFDCSKAEPFREWKRPEKRKYGAKDCAKDLAVFALCAASYVLFKNLPEILDILAAIPG